MPSIKELSVVTSLGASDLFPVYSNTNGDTRAISKDNLKTEMQSGLGAQSRITQYASPASAVTVTVASNSSNASVWLVLTPTASLAALTIKLIAESGAIESQEISVFSTQTITTLTIDGNGSTTAGAPTTLAANGFFTLRFDPIGDIWRRVA